MSWPRKKLQRIVIGVGTVGGLALIFAQPSCKRVPQVEYPPIGQVFTIKPAVKNGGPEQIKEELRKTDGILLTVHWSSRPLMVEKGDPTIHFYKFGDDNPVYSAKWADLQDSYKTTGCSDKQIAALDGPSEGRVLICDGSLDINNYDRFEVETNKGRVRSATSWISWRVLDNVMGYSIQSY